MNKDKKEYWIEVNIKPKGYTQNNLLLFLTQLLVDVNCLSFHFFREGDEIRFRLKFLDGLSKIMSKAHLSVELDILRNGQLIEDYFYGCHGERGKEYVGEEELYGIKGWKIAQKYFECGSKIALMMIKKRPLEKSDRLHIFRYWHLFVNQLGYGSSDEVKFAEEYYKRYKKLVENE